MIRSIEPALGASMRSIMKSKFSVPAYVASALLGAVALLAFYESPISPLPVPALPEPPVGRFPPEMPSLPAGVQIPFRTNQQSQYGNGYNQRSSNLNGVLPQVASSSQQQVFFPVGGNGQVQTAQQRQMNSPIGGSQLGSIASNLLGSMSGSKQLVAQRKSGIDFDQQPALRSLLSPLKSSGLSAQSKMNSGPISIAGSSVQPKSSGSVKSILSYFGLSNSQASNSGSSGASGDLATSHSSPLVSTLVGNSPSMPVQAMGSNGASVSAAANSPLEPKNPGSSSAGSIFSGSNLVNKFRSYFSKSPSSFFSGSGSPTSPLNSMGDQYSRIQLVQSFMKDLPRFLSPNNRKSSASPASSPVVGSQSGSNGNQMNSANLFSNIQGQQMMAASRMQSGPEIQLPASSKTSSVQNGSGFGLMKAADRIAHALLETFTSGITQRSASNVDLNQKSAQSGTNSIIGDDLNASGKSANANVNVNANANANVNPDVDINANSVSAISSDVASNYNSLSSSQSSILQPPANQELSKTSQASSVSNAQSQQVSASHESPAAMTSSRDRASVVSRSGDVFDINSSDSSQQVSNKPVAAINVGSKQTSQSSSVSENQEQHLRKVRSVGIEYPVEANQELANRDYRQAMTIPSRAAQINNIVDYVADSYSQNRLLFNFLMNQVGLSHAVPYVEQILASGPNDKS